MGPVSYRVLRLTVAPYYGFPLDFDRITCVTSDKINYTSATGYPDHVENNNILDPLVALPIATLHVSPFMTHKKSNSVNRSVIIDLGWPSGESTNSGVTLGY